MRERSAERCCSLSLPCKRLLRILRFVPTVMVSGWQSTFAEGARGRNLAWETEPSMYYLVSGSWRVSFFPYIHPFLHWCSWLSPEPWLSYAASELLSYTLPPSFSRLWGLTEKERGGETLPEVCHRWNTCKNVLPFHHFLAQNSGSESFRALSGTDSLLRDICHRFASTGLKFPEDWGMFLYSDKKLIKKIWHFNRDFDKTDDVISTYTESLYWIVLIL